MMDQSEKFLAVQSYVTFLSDENLQDRVKLKASQDLLNNFNTIPQSKELLDYTVLHLLNILHHREAQFFSESESYQYRKIIYDIIYRLAVNIKLQDHYDKVFTILTKVLETENEENVLAFLRTVFELLKQKNTGNELKQFLKFVKGVYSELPNKLVKIFEPHPHGIIKDISESLNSILAKNIFVVTSIPSEVKNSDGTTVSYTYIPKAVASLKVLQELPAYVKLTHQMSKSFADQPIGEELQNDIAELIPLIIMATTLQPSMQHRISPGFRKDIFVEFVKIQTRALALLAHLSKDVKFKVIMIKHHQMFTRGVLSVFTLCPPETTNLRKELLIAVKNFIDTELRFLLIPQISLFFCENYISDGWTTRETLKTLAYSAVADFIYRERDKIKQTDLTKAIHLFSVNMNDQSLNTQMHIMSCKVLIGAAELIRQKASLENGVDPKRELLMRMLQATILKCKTIAMLEIPITKKRISQNHEYKLDSADETILKMKFQGLCYNVADIKVLLKTLICNVRIITPAMQKMVSSAEHEQSMDILAFTRFVKWSMRAFDIYVIDVPQDLETRQSFVPPKEDKDVLTHYSEIFTMLKLGIFREIFTATIDDIVNQFHNNNAIQIIINYFLTNTRVSSIFATILIEYLLERMTELGSDLARSNIYLRLFKLVFGCVSLFSTDNEQILYPNLHKVVDRSLQLAIEAENPLNYFLLLRALFRSIGGGSHEKLYQKFLPLLPDLLTRLSQLQSGMHKQFMKDLFIELNLSVPVRLSSLLPYISVLMDPLMTALNGSDALIVRGLRTLELCVDNLQSEFLHAHIQPVQAELMQALWRIMRNPSEQIASTAFRLLGKFGGGNRDQMMTKLQKLKYTDHTDDFSSIRMEFQETTKSIKFPVAKIVVAAANQLKSPNADLFDRKLCWDILYHYLAAAIKSEDNTKTIFQHFSQTTFQQSTMPEQLPTCFFRNIDVVAAEGLQKVALAGILRALTMDDFGPEVKETSVCILRHYILITVAQQVGPVAVDEEARTHILDPCTILVDAIAEIMSDEENDLCRVGNLALFLTLQIAIDIFGSVNKASELPLIQHLSEKLSALCYNQAWYVKFGGCKAIKFFIEYMPARWVFKNYLRFFKANMFAIVDLSDELSYGTVAEAKKNLNQMIILFSPAVVRDMQDDSISEIRTKVLSDVTQELIQHLKIPQKSLREQSMASLLLLSNILEQTMPEILNTYYDLLKNMIPPKNQVLKSLTVEEQIGLIEGATFCATHAPALYNLGLQRHADFFQEILSIGESEDANLTKQPCYTDAAKVRQLRISVLKALATCSNVKAKREDIFRILYNTLTSSDEDLQQVGFECSKTFTTGLHLKPDFLHTIMRPLLLSLGDHRNLTLNNVRSLHFLTQLFPGTYNMTLCDLLGQHLKNILETIAAEQKPIARSSDTIKIIATIIEIFHCIPAATIKFVEVLCALTICAERFFVMEYSSPFRAPLIKFLVKFPTETLNWFLQDKMIKNHQLSKYLVHFLERDEGKPLRDLLKNNPSRLVTMLLLRFQSGSTLNELDKHEIRYQAVKILSIIVKLDEHWLLTQVPLVTALKQNWCNEEFQQYHKKTESVNYRHWEEPKLMIKIMLLFVKHNPDNISLLFNLLRATCSRFICDFQFLYDFLEHDVADNYPVEWKRNAFFQFVELFAAMNVSEVLKLKIMQLIILPSFSTCFERNEGTSLIQGVPEPNQDNPRNVVSVFFDRIISLENLIGYTDAMKIFLLRFLCLLMEKALKHLKKLFSTSETYLLQLLKFARGCTTFKSCVDPIAFYLGHLLMSHIIANFLVSKKMVEHVFINLIKGVVPEAKNIITQALDILIPTLKDKLEDDNKTLLLSTKKVILEDSANMYQLTHALQMVIRHQDHFYPGKQTLMQPLLNSFARLALNPVFDHKKLSVDLAEVMINWELRSMRENKDPTLPAPDVAESTSATQPKIFKTYEVYTEVIVNYILRLICRLYEPEDNKRKQPSSAYEVLFQRCVDLVKIIAGSETLLKGMTIKSYTVTCIRDLFYSVNTSQANHENVCCTLKLLELIFDVMNPEQLLAIPSLDQLQNGLSSCILSSHPKVTKSVNDCLSILTRIFPIESSSSELALSNVKQFESLYKSINMFILKGLLEFESNDSAELNPLVNKMTLMETICTINPRYVDDYINSTMKVFQKLVKSHPALAEDQQEISSELIMTVLKILAPGVGKMNVEMHRSFIETIGSMIENFQDARVVRAILRTLENWLKDDKSNKLLTTKQKCTLMVKMMQHIEKRFPEDQLLNGHFLELILYVYHEESLQSTELMYKLENAFLCGLRCKDPLIRAKFFDLFDCSIPKHIYDRLLYVVCSQNWNNIGPYYWIKQCTELLLLTAHQNHNLELENPTMMLTSLSRLINISGDLTQISILNENESEDEIKDVCDVKYDLRDFDLSSQPKKSIFHNLLSFQHLSQLQGSFMKKLRTAKTKKFLYLAAQLCYKDTNLAEQVWLDLFPRLWTILDKNQQDNLISVIGPFVCSGIHLTQSNCQPSALGTFIEGLTYCNPPIPISPPIIKYVSKTHNLWHMLTLSLEDLALAKSLQGGTIKTVTSDLDVRVFESLLDMYDALCEEDMWSGLWQEYAEYEESGRAIALEQQGCLEEARKTYSDAMDKFRLDYNNQSSYKIQKEALMWEQQWISCTKKLCQWDTLIKYANNRQVRDPFLILECAWKASDWELLKETLKQLESNIPKEMVWKINLYRGFLAAYFAGPEQNVILVERYIDVISSYCIREWQKLPEIVSHVHLPLLHASQQVTELREASVIREIAMQNQKSALQDITRIFRSWHNRLPAIADTLDRWSDILTWRQHIYHFVFNTGNEQQSQGENISTLGVNASAQAIITFSNIARKHQLYNLCMESLQDIYSLPTVPVINCLMKIKEQVKCYHDIAVSTNDQSIMAKGLEMIELTNVEFFPPKMTAELFALKGMLHSQMENSDDASLWFSAALQLNDESVGCWALWGEHLEKRFFKLPDELAIAKSAITCFLHSCRHQNELKSRKYVAKIIWLLNYDDEQKTLLKTVESFITSIAPIHWLPWIPQLLQFLITQEDNVIPNLLGQVGRVFPQAIYFEIRTLYLKLKVEQMRKHMDSQDTDNNSDFDMVRTISDPNILKATPAMYTCSKIMHFLRTIHPIILYSLESIVDQNILLRESWHEEVLRLLRQSLQRCYSEAFATSSATLREAKVTPQTERFLSKLIGTIEIGLDNSSATENVTQTSSTLHQTLSKRLRLDIKDSDLSKRKKQFLKDFEPNPSGGYLLLDLIMKLRQWIKFFEDKMKRLPKTLLIDEKYQYLNNLSFKTADIELPGELLSLTPTQYYVKIAKFMPEVDIVQRNNISGRRIYIRGHNGNLYPYLIIYDSGFNNTSGEARVFQLFRFLNQYFNEQKETSCRMLNLTVPRIVSISPKIRLIQDNPASLTMLDIYSQYCQKTGIEVDDVIQNYYNRLTNVFMTSSEQHSALKDIFRTVQQTLVPRTVLKDWIFKTFPSSADYWTFRKIFTMQLSVINFVRYVFDLTKLNPDIMNVHKDTGLINVNFFTFQLRKTDDNSSEVNDTPAGFRLTPNLVEFLTNFSINGPLTANVIAAARCISQPTFDIYSIIRAIFRDEIPKNDIPNEMKRQHVIKNVNNNLSLIESRIRLFSAFHENNSKIKELINISMSEDCLSRMDPSWYPWL